MAASAWRGAEFPSAGRSIADPGSWRTNWSATTYPGPFDTWSGPASIEVLLGGLRIEATDDLVIAVTGASVAVTLLDVDDDDKHDMELNEPIELTAGSPTSGYRGVGLRAYVGVAGGIDVDPTLGSRSTDTTSDLGPHVLAKVTSSKSVGRPVSLERRHIGPQVSRMEPTRGRAVPTPTRIRTDDFRCRLAGPPHLHHLASEPPLKPGWRSTDPETTGIALMPTSATLPSSATLPGAVQALPTVSLL